MLREDLGDKSAALFENTECDLRSCEEELGLQVFVEVVQAGDVGSAVADDELSASLALALHIGAVASGPSESARLTASAVAGVVMSPMICVTPGKGAMA